MGVRERFATGSDNLVFRKNVNTGGGVFVTADPQLIAELHDLPKGTLVSENNTPAKSPIDEEAHKQNIRGSAEVNGFYANGDEQHSGGTVTSPTDMAAFPNAPQSSYLGLSHTHSQQQPPTTSLVDFGLLEGVPGNMFDWGALSRSGRLKFMLMIA